MSKNTKIIAVVVIVAALGISFYSGVKYDQGKVASAAATRAASFAGGRGTRTAGAGQFGGGGGGTAGSIISSDSNSVTISLRAGGSQIIFYSPATSITTTASGTPTDFVSGKQIIVQGTANTDGSINATSIQVR